MRSSAHAQPPPPQTPVQAPPPPPPAAAAPPPQGAQGAALNAEQQALVQQVMQLTQEQIDALPAGQREQLMMLRQQVMSGQLG
jgi:cleavage stimulation factor subunit 2